MKFICTLDETECKRDCRSVCRRAGTHCYPRLVDDSGTVEASSNPNPASHTSQVAPSNEISGAVQEVEALSGERLTEVCTRISSAVIYGAFADFDFEARAATEKEISAARAIETWLRCYLYEIRPQPTNKNPRNGPFLRTRMAPQSPATADTTRPDPIPENNPPPSETEERVKFEAWIHDTIRPEWVEATLAKDEHGEYRTSETYASWSAWLARAAKAKEGEK